MQYVIGRRTMSCRGAEDYVHVNFASEIDLHRANNRTRKRVRKIKHHYFTENVTFSHDVTNSSLNPSKELKEQLSSFTEIGEDPTYFMAAPFDAVNDEEGECINLKFRCFF